MLNNRPNRYKEPLTEREKEIIKLINGNEKAKSFYWDFMGIWKCWRVDDMPLTAYKKMKDRIKQIRTGEVKYD